MSIVPEAILDEAARRFALLGQPARLRLVRELHERGELSVGELATATGMSMPNASQHLDRLVRGGVLGRRRAAKSVRYAIADPTIQELCDIVCAGIRERARLLIVS